MKKLLLPFLVFSAFIFIFFNRFFIKGLIPIPADIVVGTYHPWFDYDWGYPNKVPVKNPLPSDIPSVIFPFKQLAIDILKSGQLPDYNQFVLSGTELLSNGQSAVFYPLNLIYLVTDFVTGWSWQIILQPLLALITMYLLARFLKLSQLSSIFAATAFAFSGFFTTWLEYNIHGHVLALVPLIVLLSLKAFSSPVNTLFASLYSLTLAMQIFAGYPQFVLYTLISVGIFYLFYSRFNLHSFISLSIFTLLGLSTAAIQLLPTFDFISTSNRLFDSGTLANSNFGFFPWQQLVTLFAPNFFGNPATQNYTGINHFDNFSSYPGIITLTLAFYSLRFKHKIKSALYVLLLLCLFLSLSTPLSQLLFKLNILGFGSAVAARAMAFFTFSLAILSGFGLEHLRQEKSKFFHVIPLAVLLFAALLKLSLYYLLNKELHPDPALFDYHLTSLRNLVLPFILVIATFLLVMIKSFFNKKPLLINLIIISFILLNFFDLFLFANKYLSYTARNLIFPSTPITDFLVKHKDDGRIMGADTIPMNMWVPYHLRSASGYDALYSKQYATFLGDLTGAGHPLGRYGLITYATTSAAFQSTATKYIVAQKFSKGVPSENGEVDYRFQLPSLKPIFSDKTVVVLENTITDPYLYLSSGDKKTPLQYVQQLNGDLTSTFTASSPSTLIAAISYSPSWKAELDNSPVTLSAFNNTFISLNIPPGNHSLKLTFHPRTINTGFTISMLSLILLLLLVSQNLRKK